MQRTKPLPRSTTPLKRTPLKPRTTYIAKTGKVGKRKQAFRDRAKAYYFANHGEKKAGAKHVTAPCQLCGLAMKKVGCHIHHKKPRGEGGPDTYANAVALHANCHMIGVHAGVHGRPSSLTLNARRFYEVEHHEANITNGKIIADQRGVQDV